MEDSIPILVASISSISAVFIAYLQLMGSRRQKKTDEENERQRAEMAIRDQRRESLLFQLLKSSKVNGALAKASAHSFRNCQVCNTVESDKNNYELKEALSEYEMFQNEMDEYITKTQASSFNQTQSVKIETSPDKTSPLKIAAGIILSLLGAILLNNLWEYLFNPAFN